MANFLGSPKVQFFKTGTVDYLSGGKLYSYDAGTTTARNTYPTIADALAFTNANANPVILDTRGEANVVISGSTKLILKDANDNVIWTVDNVGSASQDILDSNGNEVLKFVSVSSAVNELTVTNAATSNSPILSSTGGDTNVGFKITSKGSGTLFLDAGSTGTVDIGTSSTGAINLKRNTAITGTCTVSSTLEVTGGITVPAAGPLNFIPAGCVMWKASTNVPTGWLECNGAAVSRTTYATLFTDLGTTYGSGDGSTTFNLPNQERRVIVGKGGTGTATLANTIGSTGGAETHTLDTTQIPAHTHTYSLVSAGNVMSPGGNAVYNSVGSAASGSAGGGLAHNNMQPSLVMMMIIKAY